MAFPSSEIRSSSRNCEPGSPLGAVKPDRTVASSPCPGRDAGSGDHFSGIEVGQHGHNSTARVFRLLERRGRP